MLKVSHSQRATAEDCWRKWAFSYIAEMRPAGSHSAFKGSKTHEVIERWLREEDPFPPGWNDGLDNESASRIRAFIDQGVTNGLLFRHPEQLIEEYFERDLIPGVRVRGYIDWMMPGLIVDHKTSSNRRWMHGTEASLAQDKQLLTYAKVYFDNHPSEDVVLIRHNQFVWTPGPKSVHALTATATREAAEKNWKELQDFAKKALDLHSRADTLTIVDDIDPPDDPTICTSKYGGCPFQRICLGSTSVDEMQASLSAPKLGDLLEAAEQEMNATPNKPEPGLISGAQATPMSDPSLTMTLKEMQGHLYDSDALWAVPSCDLCGGTGWLVLNSEPCLECQSTHNDRITMGGSSNGVNSEHFDGNGSLKPEFEDWAAFYASLNRLRKDGQRPGVPPADGLDGAPDGDESVPYEAAQVEQQEEEEVEPVPKPKKFKLSKAAKEAKGEAEQADDDGDDQEGDDDQEPDQGNLERPQKLDPKPKTSNEEDESLSDLPTEQNKKSRGRPKGGLTLVRGAVHRSTCNKVLPLTEVWANCAALAGFKSIQGYYQSNAFERRDAVCAAVQLWMAKNNSRMIVWHSGTLSPDLQPLWDCLQMYAKEIFTT